MGAKTKTKLMAKKLKKASVDATPSKSETPDFLSLEGGPERDLAKIDDKGNRSTVLYIGRIPHGFYESEMEAFFKQFGVVKRLKISRNKKTGKSKHFGFIEFESAEVAKVVSECMHNYLMYEHLLQVSLVPPERVHPKLWKGANRSFKLVDWVQVERQRHDKERTLDQHQNLVARVLKRGEKKRKKIEAAGIDYKCPEMIGNTQLAPKKIKFVSE